MFFDNIFFDSIYKTKILSLKIPSVAVVILLFSSNVYAEVSVTGSSISWPDDGWYQVQTSDTYSTVCEGVSSCTVDPGRYIVINHTTGQRWENILVNVDGSEAPSILGQTISWPDNGWYQVQRANGNYESICEGGTSCVVEPGDYIVINHSAGERWENLRVDSNGASTVEPGSPIVEVNSIVFPDNAWYEVQEASSFSSICEGRGSCEVGPGNYIVINHHTGQRIDGIVVAETAQPQEETDQTAEDMDSEGTDSGDTDSEDADSGDTDSEDTDSGDMDSEDTDSGDTDSEDTDSGDMDSEETDSGDMDSEETDSGDMDSEETDSGDMDSEETDPGDMDSEDTDASDIDSEDTDSGDTDSEEVDSTDMDVDSDGDGIFNVSDNCVAQYNPNQDDFDGDAIGDVCDTVIPDICPCSAGQWIVEVNERIESSAFQSSGGIFSFLNQDSLQIGRNHDVFQELSAAEIGLLDFDNYSSGVNVRFSDSDFRNTATINCNGLFNHFVQFSTQTMRNEVRWGTFVSDDYENRTFNEALSCAAILYPEDNLLADQDSDGVLDITDNCVAEFNPDQLDSGGNPLGDACEGN